MNKWLLVLVVLANVAAMVVQMHAGNAVAAGIWGLASGVWFIQAMDAWFKRSA